METLTSIDWQELDTLLQQELEQLSEREPLRLAAASARLCRQKLTELKEAVLGAQFMDKAEEITFFKEVKPLFYSRYIYYVGVYNFLLQRPTGGETIQQDYIRMHLNEIKTYFDHNRLFYAYYRSGMTQLDEAYYTRGGFAVHAELEDFEEDQQYSTSHDYKRSKLMANERFQEYLNRELAQLQAGPETLLQPFKPAQWTASQTDAIELIYALKASGSVNNGNIGIADLVNIFEHTFSIELKEYYHKYTDITRRKKDMSIFLNKLKDGLLRWIDDKMGL